MVNKLRGKRMAAGIPGHSVCQKIGMPRSRLTGIERGYLRSSPEELQRIDAAIDEILRTRQQLEKLASKEGLSLTGIRL
jgi:hypothetical protein